MDVMHAISMLSMLLRDVLRALQLWDHGKDEANHGHRSHDVGGGGAHWSLLKCRLCRSICLVTALERRS